MTDFYVSSLGVDTYPGTMQYPIKTLARLQEMFGSGAIIPGDRVFLRCGDTFWGGLTQPYRDTVFGNVVTVTSYGYGNMPVVSGFKILGPATVWNAGPNDDWSTSIAAGAVNVGGASHIANTGVGFLEINGVIYGAARESVDELVNQWDYCVIGDTLTVKSAINPNNVTIRAASKLNGYNTSGATRIENIEFYGFGGHGVRVGTGSNVAVTGCKIHAIGGAYLSAIDRRRYGNGVEVWVSSRNMLVENCEIYDVYDTATTMQGNSVGGEGWSNVWFRKNLIYRCTQSFEVWATANSGGASGIANSGFVDNHCFDAGNCWGYEYRPDQDGTGVHVLKYNITVTVDLEIARNKFIHARSAYFYNGQVGGFIPSGMRMNDNEIVLNDDQKIEWQYPFLIGERDEWTASRDGRESRSALLASKSEPQNLHDAVQTLASDRRRELAAGYTPAHEYANTDHAVRLSFGRWAAPAYSLFDTGSSLTRMLLVPVVVDGGSVSRVAYTVGTAGVGQTVHVGVFRGSRERGFSRIAFGSSTDVTLGLKQIGLTSTPLQRNELLWVGLMLTGPASNMPLLGRVRSANPYVFASSPDDAINNGGVAYAVNTSTVPEWISPTTVETATAGYRVAIGNA